MSFQLKSLKYTTGQFEVLDQLVLPHETKFIPVKTVQDAWSVIRTMQVRGAPLIAITAALGLAVDLFQKKDSFQTIDALVEYVLNSIQYLRTSRPTAVNLFIAMDELTAFTEKEKTTAISASNLTDKIIAQAEQIYADDVATNRAIGLNGARKISQLVNKDKIKVLTICNTGSLATAGYGTALGVVRALQELGKLDHVYACETRPYNQGARLTAYEIVQDSLPGTLITDSMASALMALKGVDVVVVGADRVAGNGDTANKIGTYQLAIAANYHKIPFFVAAPTTTLDLTMASGAEIHIEERPAHELTSVFGQKLAPDGISVWNPAFDVTPCVLITGIITELGVIEQAFVDPKGMSRNSDPVIPVAAFLKERLQRQQSSTTNAATSGITISPYLQKRLEKVVEPISIPIGYERMDASKIASYVFSLPKLLPHLGLTASDSLHPDRLKIEEVGDGNLNFVYIVQGQTEHHKIVIKQALPFVRCVGENWPLTLRRAFFEYSALTEERKLTTATTISSDGGRELVPEVYHFDATRCLIVMRYIAPPHLILRKHLIAGVKISSFARDIGVFAARTLFGNSALALSGGEFRAKVSAWSQNIAMCALTEKVVFTDPYDPACSLNHWTKPYLDRYVELIQKDAELKLAAAYHKNLFLTKTETLIHGDLHTGSIMAMEGSTFVIDPEFAYYGPMGFDLGAIFANLYLAYFAWSAKDPSSDYGDWLLEQAKIVWVTFEETFRQLWNESAAEKRGLGELYVSGVYDGKELAQAQEEYLQSVWRDTLGFTGSKMIRRIVGIAHVADLESIADLAQRSIGEKRAIVFARRLVIASYTNQIRERGLTDISAINGSLARSLLAVTPKEDSLE